MSHTIYVCDKGVQTRHERTFTIKIITENKLRILSVLLSIITIVIKLRAFAQTGLAVTTVVAVLLVAALVLISFVVVLILVLIAVATVANRLTSTLQQGCLVLVVGVEEGHHVNGKLTGTGTTIAVVTERESNEVDQLETIVAVVVVVVVIVVVVVFQMAIAIVVVLEVVVVVLSVVVVVIVVVVTISVVVVFLPVGVVVIPTIIETTASIVLDVHGAQVPSIVFEVTVRLLFDHSGPQEPFSGRTVGRKSSQSTRCRHNDKACQSQTQFLKLHGDNNLYISCACCCLLFETVDSRWM